MKWLRAPLDAWRKRRAKRKFEKLVEATERAATRYVTRLAPQTDASLDRLLHGEWGGETVETLLPPSFSWTSKEIPLNLTHACDRCHQPWPDGQRFCAGLGSKKKRCRGKRVKTPSKGD